MVENTPNHGLHKYAKGDQDWTHSPDMQTIEERLVIRDVEGNLQNYTPHAAATFVATDTGAVYDGTGDSWTAASRGFETVATNSVEAARVTATESITYPDGSVVTSPSGGNQKNDGIIRGYNGVSGGGADAEVNPSGYADAAKAIQDVVDSLESNQSGGEQGIVYVPHVDPDGNELTISSTVTFGNNGGTYPSFIGNMGRNGPYIQVTINDGSPAFHLDGIRMSGGKVRGANADADANDCEFIRFTDVDEPVVTGGNLRAFCGPSGSVADGAIVVDSESYNGGVYRTTFNGIPRSGMTDVSGMKCIAAANSTGTTPGEFHVTGISTYADPSYPIDSVVSANGVGWSNVVIVGNRMEGAGGNGLIDFDSGYFIAHGNDLNRTQNSADRVHADCFAAFIGPNDHSGTAGGNGVFVRVREGVVHNSVRYGNVGSYAIDANYNPGGSGKLQVPNPDAIAAGNSVNYQSGASNVEVVQTSTPS